MDESPCIDRRGFLKTSSYASIGLIGLRPFRLADLPRDEKRSILVVHTNDMHSRVDPFPDDHPRYAGLGGMADRATLIDNLRQKHKDILLLDAGDIFQGTPYFNFFGGSLELELMSKMGYDAATMGNHDFDGGMDGFLQAQLKADFPFICSNYSFRDTPLENMTLPYKVIKRNGIRIGLFGLGIELKGLVDQRLCEGVRYHNPIEIAGDRSYFLRNELKCDMVICLSHLGYRYDSDKVSDLKVAEAVDGIDLIIGGHTHTFLDRPTIIEKSPEKNTYVNQVGWAGVRLGVLEFQMAKERRVKGISMQAKDIRTSG